MSRPGPQATNIPVLAEPRLPAPDDAIDCSTGMQATLLPEVRQLLVETATGPAWVPTPYGAVILSQTCDLAQSNRHSVQVSPLAQLDGTDAADAARENRPRFAPVWDDAAGEDEAAAPVGFADLEVIATWTKSRLAQERQVPASWHTSVNTRRFGRAVGRRFSRFAWPDNVQPWLRPLETVLQKRYNEATQATGRVVADLMEVRAEADDWNNPDAHISLHFIFNPGVLPPSDLVETPTADCIAFIEGGPTWKQIAERLDSTEDVADRALLYDALVAAWADLCKPKASAPSEVHAAVAAVEGLAWSGDEFSLHRARSSPNLDVDYVSEPEDGS